MDKTLKIVAVSEIQTAKDERQFYTVTFQDETNIFSQTRTRNIWQQRDSSGKPVWKTLPHEQAVKLVGRKIPGEIVERQVEPYQVADPISGEIRTVNKYTAVVFGNEDIASTFKGLNHPLAGTVNVAQEEVQEATAIVNPPVVE